MRMRQVTESMQMSRARTSDQAAVWADIAAKSERMDARSETGAMEEIFAVHAKFALSVASRRSLHRSASVGRSS